MRILMLSAYFPPEIGSAAHLFHDLGRAFVERGYAVTVLTGFPSYHVDKEKDERRSRPALWRRETMNGLRVLRVRSFRLPRRVPLLRGLDQVVFSGALALSGSTLLPGFFDIILTYSPPLFLGLSAQILRRLKKAKTILNVQDLFPQSAIDLGLLNNKALIGLFRAVEAYLYKKSDAVTVHSAGNRSHVLRRGGDDRRTGVIPNFVDTREIRPGARYNSFRKRHGIREEEYLVSFAGVIGLSQDIDVILDAAARLKALDPMAFLIVGDGLEKPRLVGKASGMTNVRFLPMLSKEEYAELLPASDISLVTLRKEVQTPVVPSKIMSIMAAGRPVVASLPLAGDSSKLIDEAKSGICVPPESPDHLAQAILRLYENSALAEELGRNGRSYVEEHFSIDVCAGAYEKMFRELLPGRHVKE